MTDTANITQEAHEALVRKAVEDATKTVEAALATKTEEVAALKVQVDDLTSEAENLKLFEDEFVTTERASRWAALSDEAWNEQVEEWKQLKPAPAGSTDTASSAMTGTSDLTKDEKSTDTAEKKSNRRAVLALH